MDYELYRKLRETNVQKRYIRAPQYTRNIKVRAIASVSQIVLSDIKVEKGREMKRKRERERERLASKSALLENSGDSLFSGRTVSHSRNCRVERKPLGCVRTCISDAKSGIAYH